MNKAFFALGMVVAGIGSAVANPPGGPVPGFPSGAPGSTVIPGGQALPALPSQGLPPPGSPRTPAFPAVPGTLPGIPMENAEAAGMPGGSAAPAEIKLPANMGGCDKSQNGAPVNSPYPRLLKRCD